MKNILILFLSCFFASVQTEALATHPAIVSNATVSSKAAPLTYKAQKTVAEKMLGRKLSLKERMALRIQTAFPRYDKDLERKANNEALIGFIFSMAGLVLLWPLLIPGLIISSSALRKERIDPGILEKGNYGLAKAGKIIGIIGLAIIALAIIIIAAVISSGVYI
ncbi:MAG: hypothetical protein U0T11_00340 [Chitinophagaceae bacterium]